MKHTHAEDRVPSWHGRSLPIFVGALGWLVLCSGSAMGQPSGEKPLVGNSGYEIPSTELPLVQRAALAGDPKAAFRITTHYGPTNPASIEYRFWVTIAAENGSPNGEYSLGYMLAIESDKRSQERALFWLKKAEKDGVALATSLLKEIQGRQK